MFGIENSTVDPNRFYSILLDARAASVSENMCDIAEKLLAGEKDNAKGALEHLWKLKKSLFSGKNATIDMLIDYYQEKMDILRGKEEHLKKVSVDSRNLLEEKRRKDEEVATVKQQVADCTKEISELTEKLDKLRIKEQELVLIEHQLNEELHRNENEIVNGLYEIILAQQEQPPAEPPTKVPPKPLPLPETAAPVTPVPEQASPSIEFPPPPTSPIDDILSTPAESRPATAVFEPPPVAPLLPEELAGEKQEPADLVVDSMETGTDLRKVEPPPFPKSVVKTTGGRIIGEYYYDGQVYKNERHYIFSSIFFTGELLKCIRQLKLKFELSVYTEMLQMVQDAVKRIIEDKEKRLHFEVATNEILNEKTLRRLWQDSKLRSIDEVERFGVRLQAKIDALGANYVSILQEQMQRCTQNS